MLTNYGLGFNWNEGKVILRNVIDMKKVINDSTRRYDNFQMIRRFLWILYEPI